jgi:hypothetical protein
MYLLRYIRSQTPVCSDIKVTAFLAHYFARPGFSVSFVRVAHANPCPPASPRRQALPIHWILRTYFHQHSPALPRGVQGRKWFAVLQPFLVCCSPGPLPLVSPLRGLEAMKLTIRLFRFYRRLAPAEGPCLGSRLARGEQSYARGGIVGISLKSPIVAAADGGPRS